MLGKGLESLIPQKGGNGGNDNNSAPSASPQPGPGTPPSSSAPAWKPQNQQPASQKNNAGGFPPPLELPVLEEELDLPAGNTIPDASVRQSQPEPLPSEALAKLEKREPIIASSAIAEKFARKDFAREPAAIAPPQIRPMAEQRPSNNLPSESIFQIEVEKIVPNPHQPRRVFDEESLKDMAHSIREFGILQPLIVTKIKKEKVNGMDVEYQLIAGERRLLASKIAGLKTVPAIIRNIDLEREKFELAIIENIQRENLNPIESARAFERLRDEFKLTQREIAAKLGKSREVVANSVRLLDLPMYVQDAIQKGTIQESTARFLLAVDDQAEQRKIFDDIIERKLTSRDVRERVSKYTKHPGRPPGSGVKPVDMSPEVKALRDGIAANLGAPVEIEKRANDGRITITFYSEEELEGILKKLGKEQ